MQSHKALTVRSVLASLFGILATGLCVQFFEIIEASGNFIGAYAVPVAAMMMFAPVLVLSGVFGLAARRKLLTRTELLFVLFSMMIAAPLTSSGFWSMMIGPLGTIPKTGYFEVYDALPGKIWPHSENILSEALSPENKTNLVIAGNVNWEMAEVEPGVQCDVAVIDNESVDDYSSIKIPVRIAGPNDTFNSAIVPEEPYLLDFFFRPKNLGVESRYVCRVYFEDKKDFDVEVFSARTTGEVNYLYRTGFMRQGMYNLVVPLGTKGPVLIEIGLEGAGRLEIAEGELLSVGALDAIYRGRKSISPEEARRLPPGPMPHRLIEEPASAAGRIGRYLEGNTPWKEWAAPFVSWSVFGCLLLIGTMCIAVIMYRQWVENERYPMPMTRIPMALLTADEGGREGEPPLLKRRIVWVGFGLSLFWCLMKGWHAFNTNVPNMNIAVDLSPYFTDPMWGLMWKGVEVRNVTFTVTAIFVSLAIFMEINVLYSLVLGFFLYRCQFWFGEVSGLALQKEYPYYMHQQIGAFLAYGLIVLFFTRKHLWKVLRKAFGKTPKDDAEEAGYARAYRGALGGLALSFVVLIAWSKWNGIAAGGMIVLYLIALMIGFVAMKLRAECGTVMGGFTPVALIQALPIAGGMILFGPKGVIFFCLATYFIFQYIFFLTPGMQMELLDMSKRFRISGKQIALMLVYVSIVPLLLGGWMHLNLGFSIGGDNYTQRWPYMDKTFIMNDYNTAMAEANKTLQPADSPEAQAGGGIKPFHVAYIFGAVVTVILSILRQSFSGFWFHPIGFIVGSTVMMEYVWGSVLAAAIIRWMTFKIGGAVTVRMRLMPFFVGVFMGAVMAYIIFACINAYLYFYHPSILRPGFGMLF